MGIIVTGFGLLITLIGLLVLIRPLRFIAWIGAMPSKTRFWTAISLRLVFGALFFGVAPVCRSPIVVQIVGGIAIVAALGLLIVGRARLDQLVAWWLEQSAMALRAWSLIAIAFGILLIYAGG